MVFGKINGSTNRLRIRIFFLFAGSALITVCHCNNMTTSGIYHILDFGASVKSINNARAIQSAIDACSAAGGGEVVIPRGQFKSGTVMLKDGVTLRLEKGATLLGSPQIVDYPMVRDSNNVNKTHPWRGLIAARNAHNIAVIGAGIVDGNGTAEDFKCYPIPNHPQNFWHKPPRPAMIFFTDCKQVTLQGITFQRGATWGIRLHECQNVRVQDLEIYNHVNANNDGLDIDACQDVLISDCRIDSDDDGLCFKAISDRPCKNVVVTGCIIAAKTTALKFGNEVMADMTDILISNCLIRSSTESNDYDPNRNKEFIAGIGLVSDDGAEMARITITNCNIIGYKAPLYIRLGYNQESVFGKPSANPARLQNITLSNLYITGASRLGIPIIGLPGHPIQNIHLENITIEMDGGVEMAPSIAEYKNDIHAYPFPGMFGKHILPAKGFFLMDTREVIAQNIQVITKEKDLRPNIVTTAGSGGFQNEN